MKTLFIKIKNFVRFTKSGELLFHVFYNTVILILMLQLCDTPTDRNIVMSFYILVIEWFTVLVFDKSKNKYWFKQNN